MEVTKTGFLVCPKCGKKTNTKVLPCTVMKDFPLYCNRCREAFIVSYVPDLNGPEPDLKQRN